MKEYLNDFIYFMKLKRSESSVSNSKTTTRGKDLLILLYSYSNKVPPTGWLKQQKFIASQFWRLEVQDQGVSRAGSF